MQSCLLFVLLALPPFAAPSRAGETPETLLIRQALANDISGYRRADTELALKAYHPRFVAYEGHANGDPRAWTDPARKPRCVRQPASGGSQRLNAMRSRARFPLSRCAPPMLLPPVWIPGASSIARPARPRRLSSIASGPSSRKRTTGWLRAWSRIWATRSYPRRAHPPTARSPSCCSAKAKRGKPAAASLGFFDADFTGCEALGTFKPASYKIAFSGSEELEKWLDKRLPYVQYDLDRKVLHTAVGPAGDEALAVTREKVAVEHVKGPAKHHQERYVFWTLSRRSGSWKITNMIFNLGLELSD